MSVDVFGADRFPIIASHELHPRQQRRICKLLAAITTRFGDTHGHIVNVSEGGLGMLLDPLMRLRPGEKITVRDASIGELTCTVRWTAHPQYGVEFEPLGKKSKTVRAFYDSLPAHNF